MPSSRAAAMMWRSIAPPTPRRRAASATCIDLTSPWSADSRFSAPKPKSVSPSQTRPEADVGRPQPGKVEGVGAAGRRLGASAGQVDAQQADHARVSRSPGTIRTGGLLPGSPHGLDRAGPSPHTTARVGAVAQLGER